MIERRSTRRAFLVTGLVSLGGIAAFGASRFLRDEPEEAITRHVGAALDEDALRKVGEAYLRAHPEEDSEQRLVRLLQERRAWRRVSRAEEVRSLLRSESRRDYRIGRVTTVERWFLSETEARLCALATFA